MHNTTSQNYIPTNSRHFSQIGALRLGLIAISTDHNSETELHRALPDNVHLFTQRIQNQNPVTTQNLSAMSTYLSDASTILSSNVPLHAIMYGCTSGTLAIGEQDCINLIQNGREDIAVTTPITAIKAAFDSMNIKHIHLMTPYTLDVLQLFTDYYAQIGLNIVKQRYLNFDNDFQMTSLSPETIFQIACDEFNAQADALFISCTALRSLSVLKRIEDQLGIPVISSNQAMLWHAINLSRAHLRQEEYSQIMQSLQPLGNLFRFSLNTS